MGDGVSREDEELSYEEGSVDSKNTEPDIQKESVDSGGSELSTAGKPDNQSTSGKSSIDALEREFENSVQEIDRQLDVLNNLGDKSLKLSQATFVFIGLLGTGASLIDPSTLATQIVDGSGCAINTNQGCITNYHLGSFTLVGSLLGLFLFLMFSGPETYVDNRRTTSNDLKSVLEGNVTQREHLENKIERYRERIDKNKSIMVMKNRIINIAILLVSLSVASVTILIFSITTEQSLDRRTILSITGFGVGVISYMLYLAPNDYLIESSGLELVYEKIDALIENDEK